jgi:hypothetical protein
MANSEKGMVNGEFAHIMKEDMLNSFQYLLPS